MDKPKDIRSRCLDFSVTMIDFLESLKFTNANKIISDQLLRSSCSIGANITEAKSSSTLKEFKRFYEIALKSANESTYWLEILQLKRSSNLVELQNSIKSLNMELAEISKIIAKSIITIKQKLKTK